MKFSKWFVIIIKVICGDSKIHESNFRFNDEMSARESWETKNEIFPRQKCVKKSDENNWQWFFI
jgi:hypothetical protein